MVDVGTELVRQSFFLERCPLLFRPLDRCGARWAAISALALFEILATVAIVPADVILDSRSAEAGVHVDSPDRNDCPSSHGDLFCQVVRSLSDARSTGPIGDATLVSAGVVPNADIFETERVGRSVLFLESVIPRGPPF